jgi:SPP1 gp7 family putative phage head morphogenesis protein
VNLQALQQVRARAAVAAMAGTRRRRHRVPKQQQPNSIRLAYSQALLVVTRRAHELVQQIVVPALPALAAEAKLVHDSEQPAGYADAFLRLVKQAAEALFGEFTNERLRRLAESFGARVSDFNRQQLARQFRAAIGVDPLENAPRLTKVLQAFATENAALITTVPQRYFSEIESTTLQALRTGTRAEDIQGLYEARYGVSESRARLIARDQIGKLNGQMNKVRQGDLGVTRFTWRTSEDERVRPEHVALDGKVFDWDEPPSEGLPGEPINCRCIGEPMLEDVLEAL